MGEYIKNVKLGTCEELYYTTFQQLQNSGFSLLEKTPFLKCDSGYRFRFPFPDEKFQIGTYPEFNRGVRFVIPDNIGVSLFHRDATLRFVPEKTTERVGDHMDIGVTVPCPYNENPSNLKFYRWNTDGKIVFDIIQQKHTAILGIPKLLTSARCPYCGAVSSFDETEIQAIYDHTKKSYDYSPENAAFLKLHMQIAEIALAGYTKFQHAL